MPYCIGDRQLKERFFFVMVKLSQIEWFSKVSTLVFWDRSDQVVYSYLEVIWTTFVLRLNRNLCVRKIILKEIVFVTFANSFSNNSATLLCWHCLCISSHCLSSLFTEGWRGLCQLKMEIVDKCKNAGVAEVFIRYLGHLLFSYFAASLTKIFVSKLSAIKIELWLLQIYTPNLITVLSTLPMHFCTYNHFLYLALHFLNNLCDLLKISHYLF